MLWIYWTSSLVKKLQDSFSKITLMKVLKIIWFFLCRKVQRTFCFSCTFLKTFIEQFLETEFSLTFFFINIRNSDMSLSLIGKLPLRRLPSKYPSWVRVTGCFRVRVGNNLLGVNLPGGSFPGTVIIILLIKNLS